jgi:hypothetical protein
MHTAEIRENCNACGHHEVRAIEGSDIATDCCNLAKVACSEITTCDPACRVPKKTTWDHEKERGATRRHAVKKEQLRHFVPPEDPCEESVTDLQEDQESGK